MQATKYSLSIEIEALSLDAVVGLLSDVFREMRDYPQRETTADDGDYLKWNLTKQDVEF